MNKEIKHTSGPWIVEALTDGNTFKVISQDYGTIVVVADPLANELNRSEELEANAKLIAAAPSQHDLLIEALDLVPRIGDDDPMAPALADWCRRVKALIS